jgi:hypothetical protein
MKMTAEEQREFRLQLSLTDEQMKFCATQPHVEDGPGAVITATAGLSSLAWHILFSGDGGVKRRSGDGKQNRSVCGLSRLRASDAPCRGRMLLAMTFLSLSVICCCCSFLLPGAHFGAVFIPLGAAEVDGYRHPIGHSSVRIGTSGRMQEKSMINRREGLLGVGVVAGAAAQSANGLAWSEGEAHKTRKCALDLSGFEPNSMLQVHESRVERARNGEVKTGSSQFVPSIGPLPVNCHSSQSLGPFWFRDDWKTEASLGLEEGSLEYFTLLNPPYEANPSTLGQLPATGCL